MAGQHPSGFNPHLPGRGYRMVAQGVGAMMWFFIFYRFRQDGAKLLGHHPFLDHGHDHAPDAKHH